MFIGFVRVTVTASSGNCLLIIAAIGDPNHVDVSMVAHLAWFGVGIPKMPNDKILYDIILLYYVTCYQYLYEVLLIRVATSTLNPGTKWFGIRKWDGNGNKSEDLQVSLVTWRTSIIKSTPEVLLAIARCCGVHSQALKGWPPPLSHRGNGKRPFAACGRWDEICAILEPKKVT